VYLPAEYIRTDERGLARYLWKLNGKRGDQTICCRIYNEAGQTMDSVIVHAEGKFYSNAWQVSDCLPHVSVNDLCQSGTGRLFCGLHTYNVPYYSDDRGVSWQKLSSFPVSNKEIPQIVARGNEVFVATGDNGIYYSADNGATWQNRSKGISDTREVRKLCLTRSGKLLLSTGFKPLYISTDKGLNWTEASTGLDHNDIISNSCETSTGVLYISTGGNNFYRSTTGGISWVNMRPTVS
jgi:hypothetical protein